MKKEKLNKLFIIKFCMLLAFAILPLYVMIQDTVLKVIYDPTGTLHGNFDIAISEQLQYYSVWNAIFTSVWATATLISFKTKRIGWFSSQTAEIMVVAQSLIVFGAFNMTWMFNPSSVPDFYAWYGWMKSIIEHLCIPIVLIVYFVINKEQREFNFKRHLKTNGLITMIIPTLYCFYIIVRMVLLYEHSFQDDNWKPNTGLGDPNQNWPTYFPYDFLDPYLAKNGVIKLISACLGAIIGSYIVNVLFYYFKILINKSNKISFMSNKFTVNIN